MPGAPITLAIDTAVTFVVEQSPAVGVKLIVSVVVPPMNEEAAPEAAVIVDVSASWATWPLLFAVSVPDTVPTGLPPTL